MFWGGCAVVPLSAGAPVERLSGIIVDAEATLVLVTDEGGAATGARLSANKVCGTCLVLDVRSLQVAESYDSVVAGENGESIVASERRTDSRNCDAYLYYTSGSSGEPKGVYAGHAPMMNRLRWMSDQWPFATDEVCCQRVDHVFIDFVAEMFGPLSSGIPILVVPCPVRQNPVLLKNFIRKNGVTRITLVPTLARLLIETAATTSTGAATSIILPSSPLTSHDASITSAHSEFGTVRLWILSGEALAWDVARGLAQLSLPTSRILNLFGSTEVAADVTFQSLSPSDVLVQGDNCRNLAKRQLDNGCTPSVPIGQAISGCGVELMEMEELEGGDLTQGNPPKLLRRISPTRCGQVGVLYVYGTGLAKGYWGRPDATEKCFPSYIWDSALSCYRLCSSSPNKNRPRVLNQTQPFIGGQDEIGRENGSGECRSQDGQEVRFFRTGDLASFEHSWYGNPSRKKSGSSTCDNNGGSLVYRGRLDQQVKINGQRLHLAEVEACLVRVRGVALGVAVALRPEDIDGHENGVDDEGSIHFGCCLVGVVVSPENIDKSVLLAECRRFLPKFAVPQVVVTALAVPTLPGSGKISRREVRWMVLNELHNRRGSIYESVRAASGDGDSDSVDIVQTSTHQGINTGAEETVKNMVQLVMAAVRCSLQTGDTKPVDAAVASSSVVEEECDFFGEIGITSLQAVRLVHELRHSLSLNGYRSAGHETFSVRLVDLYSHPSAQLLAQWLVSAMPSVDVASEVCMERECIATCKKDLRASDSAGRGIMGGSSGSNDYKDREFIISGVSIHPITADTRSETCTLLSDVFFKKEPLASVRFSRCHAMTGPVGTAVVRQCYRRLVSHNICSLLQRGGRVLTATDDATGQVIGFTVGTELIETEILSFPPSSSEGGETGGGGRFARRGPADLQRLGKTFSRKCFDWMLHQPLRPVMHPISALVEDLISTYQYERGWVYEIGELLYISETGCRPEQPVNNRKKGRNGTEEATATANMAGSGVRSAVLAESLERRLLMEAKAAGFIRAVTICTNAVTVHVARELGFREVSCISPVQMYRPPAGTKMTPRWWSHSRVSKSGSDHGKKPSGHRGGKERLSGPFARVAKEHANVVLFEKILVPCVPSGLLLNRQQEKLLRSPKLTESSATICPIEISNTVNTTEPAGAAATSADAKREIWKLLPVGKISWENHQQMLALLANALPDLASSGRATAYMTEDDERGQAAFVLLVASVASKDGGHMESALGKGERGVAAPRGTDTATDMAASDLSVNSGPSHLSPALRWTVAGCMSLLRVGNPADSPEAAERYGTAEAIAMSRGIGKERGSDNGVRPLAPYRELLVLAVGRRWRYRHLGTALIAWLITESRQHGDSHVFVRSLPESVGFYERHGFRRADEGGENTSDAAAGLPFAGKEVFMVHDLVREWNHS